MRRQNSCADKKACRVRRSVPAAVSTNFILQIVTLQNFHQRVVGAVGERNIGDGNGITFLDKIFYGLHESFDVAANFAVIFFGRRLKSFSVGASVHDEYKVSTFGRRNFHAADSDNRRVNRNANRLVAIGRKSFRSDAIIVRDGNKRRQNSVVIDSARNHQHAEFVCAGSDLYDGLAQIV